MVEPCGLRVGKVTFRDGSVVRMSRDKSGWLALAPGGRPVLGLPFLRCEIAVQYLNRLGYGPAASAPAGRGTVGQT